MKKLLIFFLFILPFGLKAQDGYDKETLHKLAVLTVDMQELEMRRNGLLSVSIKPDKKDIFKEKYDEGVRILLEECEKFYRSHYTPEEVKQLAAFYETPTGKKMAKETMRLVSGYFPKGNDWALQLYEMKKAKEEQKK